MPTDTVMIVGAGPGLGQALARVFARAGHPIALFARQRERLDTLVAELRSENVRVSGYGADVTNADELRSAIKRAADELGPPSVRSLTGTLPTAAAGTERSSPRRSARSSRIPECRQVNSALL